ncbi:MAG: methionyl-tRNA formyltransferase [Chloroflexi bacterium]|nr:methionyl-tRNA formyltransferase [Chloroflexota bacterium]
MRIALIGQAAFGKSVLQAIVDKGHEVIGVWAPPDAGGLDALKSLALEKGIPVFQPARMRDPGVYEDFARPLPDLGVMAYVTDIVPPRILGRPLLGTIQYHPSLLPRHRGGSAINWAVINGETKTGITIFWPDKGIDTGPILLQKAVEISPDDTVGSLYFGKLFPLGVEAIAEAVDLVARGKAPRVVQNESEATYEGLCSEKDVVIDWSRPSPQVYNLIRGGNPQPGATTFIRGRKLKVFDCELAPAASGTAGQVAEIGDKGFVVACADGGILVKRVQPGESPKIRATEYASSRPLRTGDIFGD